MMRRKGLGRGVRAGWLWGGQPGLARRTRTGGEAETNTEGPLIAQSLSHLAHHLSLLGQLQKLSSPEGGPILLICKGNVSAGCGVAHTSHSLPGLIPAMGCGGCPLSAAWGLRADYSGAGSDPALRSGGCEGFALHATPRHRLACRPPRPLLQALPGNPPRL